MKRTFSKKNLINPMALNLASVAAANSGFVKTRFVKPSDEQIIYKFSILKDAKYLKVKFIYSEKARKI